MIEAVVSLKDRLVKSFEGLIEAGEHGAFNRFGRQSFRSPFDVSPNVPQHEGAKDEL